MYGCYYFKRLPFGLNVSAEISQRYNCKAFGDIPSVEVFIDDILIHTATEEEHDKVVDVVFQRSEERNAKFNVRKFIYKQQQVKYVGQMLIYGMI